MTAPRSRRNSRSPRRAVAFGGLLLGAALLLSGCAEIRYLAQAAGGQVDLLARARPIEDVLADPATPPEIGRRLRVVQNARTFALTELGLPDRGAYTTYTDLGRPYLVWNVFAAPPLSVDLRTSCFPIAGCVVYRGYFSQGAAEAEAARLRTSGDDVFVGGVSAYSTLGRLPDPVPSSMLAYPDPTLVRTIIHELAHAVVYVQDDSVFNESFAETVENEGSRRFLERFGTPAQIEADRVARERARAFTALLMDARARLAELYARRVGDAEKLAGKREVLADLRTRYADLRSSWGGYAGYDFWFADGENAVNNAALGSVATYSALVPQFTALFGALGGDFPAFYEAVRVCAREDRARRASCLERSAQAAR